MIDEVGLLLSESVGRMRALRERIGYQAHPDSPLVKRAAAAAGELGTFGAIALPGYEIAAAQIAAAEDHMDTMAHLLIKRKGHISPLVLARAAIEAGSRAAYIIDPEVPEKDRASAVLGERIHELQQTLRLIRAHDPNGTSPEAQADLAGTERSIEVLKAFAAERDLTKPGRPTFTFVVKRTLSSATDDSSMATTAVAAYSALAHASPDMLLTHTVDRSNPEWAPFEVGLTTPNVGFLFDSVLAVMLAFTAAVNHQVRAYGWPSEGWSSWLDEAREAFGRLIGQTEDEFKRSVEHTQRQWELAGQEVYEVPLPRVLRDMRAQQKEMFEAKFGRPPGPSDPLFFDPSAQLPTPLWMSEERYVAELLELIEALGQLTPAREHAIRQCGFVASTYSWRYLTEDKKRDWKAALLEYYSREGRVPTEDLDLVVLPEDA